MVLIVSYFINEFALNIKKYLTSILGRLNEIRGLYILSDFIKKSDISIIYKNRLKRV